MARLEEYVQGLGIRLDRLTSYPTIRKTGFAGTRTVNKAIVLDSIQGEGLPSAATTAYSKVLEFARMCTQQGITVILVSH